jgi:hypothetical protein
MVLQTAPVLLLPALWSRHTVSRSFLSDPRFLFPLLCQVGAGLADGAMFNGGQSCCAVERVYAHADV